MSKIKVSVIIPVFNAAEYLIDTLNSVCNQTYKNLEIIIVDDGSTDASLEIAKRYDDDRVVVFENTGKGACVARNYGFQLSSGDYIQYLDADDLISLNKIELQIELAKVFGESYIYSCGYVRFKSDINNEVWHPQYIDKDYDNPKLWLLDSWQEKGIGVVHNWLISENLVRLAGQWNEELLLNQDGEFLSRVILNSKGIKFSSDSRVYYRSGNSNSISQKKKHSFEKASSLLKSYVLYKNSAVMSNSLEELKKGLGHNFLIFVYQYYNHFPKLVEIAKQEFHSLGYPKMWSVGGRRFKIISSLFGFETTIKLRGVVYAFKNKF